MVQYKPSQIEAIESLRESPFGTMFGCCEFECCAKIIVKWLRENGDTWTALIPDIEQLCGKHDLVHAIFIDGKYEDDRFEDDYMKNGNVTQLFIDTVHRNYDCVLRSEILTQLFPKEFSDAQ